MEMALFLIKRNGNGCAENFNFWKVKGPSACS